MSEKPELTCRKCNIPFHYPLQRNWIGRNVLFFLPIRVFFCARCLISRQLWLTNTEYRKYKRVI
ncbi:hypothetical protein [Mucilaginibacter gynuensis]|uniref:hypothetical protein n=1 Tax=Mucilaginibacter gynuensis TaxID=1302236 RepID=UPI0031EB0262